MPVNQPENYTGDCEKLEDNATQMNRVAVGQEWGKEPTRTEQLDTQPHLGRLMQHVKVSLTVSVKGLLDSDSGGTTISEELVTQIYVIGNAQDHADIHGPEIGSSGDRFGRGEGSRNSDLPHAFDRGILWGLTKLRMSCIMLLEPENGCSCNSVTLI